MSKLYDPHHTEAGPEAHSQEWHDCRYYEPGRSPAFVMGASCAGVLCGVSKYRTSWQLYHEIRGNIPPQEDNESMLWGRRLESAIIAEYEERHQVHVHTPNRLYRMVEHPMIGATPDGICEAEDGTRTLVECKCTTWRMYDPENCMERDCFGDGPDEVPSDYLMQTQQQMLVMGAAACDMPVLFDGNRLRVYTIERDEVLCDEIRHRALAFYEAVCRGEEPSPDMEHETTPALMKHMYRPEPGTVMTMPPNELDVVDEYLEAKEKEKLAGRLKEIALAKLLYIMADREVCEVPEKGLAFKRISIPASFWTEVDVEKARESLGQVKRKEYTRLTERSMK
jgi:putative phage-type endonuclease